MVHAIRSVLGGARQKRKSRKPAQRAKVKRVMREFKSGKLHSTSKQGPRVKSRKQAIAIALSEAKKV